MARARGGRVDFADLAADITSSSANDSNPIDGLFRSNMPVSDLAANPRNPRSSIGSLDDLASIAERQLQPATVVSRDAWLNLWPSDRDAIGVAKFVVINGCRRLAAATQFGRPGLDVVIRDSLASDQQTILWAAIVENIDRRDFDVIEEAHAVELLVEDAGAKAAAERLGRSEGWVSQRRALLKLDPDLQERLRRGELAVRDARSLAKVPLESQVSAWQAAQAQPGGGGESSKKPQVDVQLATVRALRRVKAQPDDLANAIRELFTPEEISDLLKQLAQ